MAIGFETTAPSTAMTVLRAKAGGPDQLLGLLQPRDDHPGDQGDPGLAGPAPGRVHRPRARLDGDRLPAVRVHRRASTASRWSSPGSSRWTSCSRSTCCCSSSPRAARRWRTSTRRVVPWDGNLKALQVINETMELRPYFEWRGLGFISHSALRVRDAYADLRRRADLRGARRPGRRPEGVPVRRGAQGRAQAVGVQGVRHRVHARRRRSAPAWSPPRAPAPRTTTSAGSPGSGCGRRPVAEHRPTEAGADRPTGPRRRYASTSTSRPPRARSRCSNASSGPAGRRPRLREERITLAHGAGGKATQTLIEAVFLDAFRNPLLEPLEDGARFAVDGASLAFTTDSYVVSPLFFPGGDIGDLAVNGTVNDLAVSGAEAAAPVARASSWRRASRSRTCSRIVASMARAAAAAGRAGRHRRHQGRAARQGRRLLHQHRRRGRASTGVTLGGERTARRRRAGVRARSATTA